VTAKNSRVIMDKPLSTSPFVKKYQLEEHIRQLDIWEPAPGNLDGILDNVVFPALRISQDPKINQLWRERVARIEDKARRTSNDATIDRFNSIEKPQLLWNWAKDIHALNNKEEAYKKMVTLLEEYPEHAKFDEWSEELIAMLNAETAVEVIASDTPAETISPETKSPETSAETRPTEPAELQVENPS